jgi:uncharacterized ion transporter superfamily protein YfcC
MTSRLPHPLVLLLGGVVVAVALTWIVPAGAYQRRTDAATKREVVIPGTYARLPATPVGPMAALLAVPQGVVAGADVILVVLVVGGAFGLLDATGALGRLVGSLVSVTRRPQLIVVFVSLAFATLGALENMQEEIIALVPLLLVVTRRVGFDALTAAAMSVGAAMVGSAFSPVNPFQAVIAMKLAGIPSGAGSGFRTVMLLLALGFWTAATLRRAMRTRGAEREVADPPPAGTAQWRVRAVMTIAVVALGLFIVGVTKWDWGFEEMGALFLALGIVAGLVGGLGVNGTAEGFAEGFRTMAYASLLIGFARVISEVLKQGLVMDSIVHGLFLPLEHLPVAVSATGMVFVQAAIHVGVPSVSGQAALTMPVLVPLSDLLGMSRQVTVLAYQTGAGMCEVLTPTNGAMMAVIAAAGVPYGKWMRFAAPLVGILVLGALVSIYIAIAIGLQ